MTRAEQIRAVLAETPDATPRHLMETLGLSKGAVAGAARAAGIKLQRTSSVVTSSGNKFFPRSYGSVQERFQSKIVIDPNSGCWLWPGDHNGRYPSIGISPGNGQKMVRVYAHRLSYEMSVGPIPKGLVIDHKCCTPMCVNPQHLQAITQRENMLRVPKERFTTIKTHCPHGHPYSGQFWKRSRGRKPYRYCPICERAAFKRWKNSDPRPKRRAIPRSVVRQVIERQFGICVCGCGAAIGAGHPTHIDHEPALRLREIATDGADYIPAQHDPRHLDARCPESHRAKTHGTGATTAGSDIGKIKKLRAREKSPKPKRAWTSRPLKAARTKWPKRKMQSRGFQKRAK